MVPGARTVLRNGLRVVGAHPVPVSVLPVREDGVVAVDSSQDASDVDQAT